MNTLLSNEYLEKWKNNSSSNLPPDFINEKDSLMLEVMRIDDHSPDGKKNPVLRREKEMHKELEQSGILEMFPIKGKSFTKEETQKVKLAAKNLYKNLVDNKDSLLVVDWYKDENTTLKLRSAVEDSLNEDLPLSYNKEIFQSKTNLLMSMFIDKAVQGMRVA